MNLFLLMLPSLFMKFSILHEFCEPKMRLLIVLGFCNFKAIWSRGPFSVHLVWMHFSTPCPAKKGKKHKIMDWLINKLKLFLASAIVSQCIIFSAQKEKENKRRRKKKKKRKRKKRKRYYFIKYHFLLLWLLKNYVIHNGRNLSLIPFVKYEDLYKYFS